MQIVRAGSLLAPNVCFLCEESPYEGQEMVDTFRVHLEDLPHLPLSGRKYVCDRCVAELGRTLGLVSSETQEVAIRRADQLELALKNLRYKLEGFITELAETTRQPVSNLIDSDVQDEPEA